MRFGINSRGRTWVSAGPFATALFLVFVYVPVAFVYLAFFTLRWLVTTTAHAVNRRS